MELPRSNEGHLQKPQPAVHSTLRDGARLLQDQQPDGDARPLEPSSPLDESSQAGRLCEENKQKAPDRKGEAERPPALGGPALCTENHKEPTRKVLDKDFIGVAGYRIEHKDLFYFYTFSIKI